MKLVKLKLNIDGDDRPLVDQIYIPGIWDLNQDGSASPVKLFPNAVKLAGIPQKLFFKEKTTYTITINIEV